MHQKETLFTCTCIVLCIASLNNNFTNFYTFDLFITFLTVICLRFVCIVEDQNLEIIS